MGFVDAWATYAMSCRIEPIKSVTKMPRRQRDGLLYDSIHRIINTTARGFITFVQTFKANAQGLRCSGNFRTCILFVCVKLIRMPVSVRSH